MKLHLINRERLQSLGSFLVDEFDNVIARVRAAWKVEHTDDGAHANVHAETTATGRLVFSDVATFIVPEAQVDNFDPAGLNTAAILRLDAAVSEVVITGIRVPQDENGAVLDGRVLVIENISSTVVFILEAENTFSSPRNRIITPWGSPVDEASPLRFYIRPSSLVTLIYNATKARWIMHGQEKDANVKYNTFAASQHDNVTMATANKAATWRMDFAGTGSISGFDSTNVPETTRVTLVNVGLFKFSFLHQNTSSSIGNRIQCPGGVQYVLNPRESVVLARTTTGWRIVEKADQWIDVAHAGGNFTVDGGGSWTVDSGDQVTLCYQIDGNKMTVAFNISTTDVGATANALKFPIPAGRTSARDMRNGLAQCLNAGAAAPQAFARVAAGGTFVEFYSDFAGTAWTATAADNTTLRGEITFMVRDDCGSITEDHTDVAHGDAGHSDADHSDVAHIDVAHVDTHSDTPHLDASHSDIAHVDTHSDVAHSDVAFIDEAHEDSAHGDSHGDDAHVDDAHQDGHGDQHIDHTDVGHADTHVDTHADVAHSDVSHNDSHSDDVHQDEAHEDVAHTDVAHSDGHSDEAHQDAGHADTAHDDSHTDSPHSDTAHVDQGHGDTPHSDSVHEDVGMHCDTSHSDI